MRPTATAIVRHLVAAGHQAVFAGGCVRDMLRGVPPKDYDIATSATPEQVLEIFPHSHAVGAAFGVVVVHQEGCQFEVATFRRDGGYSDGRRPDSVEFTDAMEDAKRRDFTVNGLFFDPIKNEVLDYIGGQQDLSNKILRAIGDAHARFNEDHLRLLRAIRFSTVLEFPMESATWAAVCALAPKILSV
ncbi:MAG: CCA tRNA nucleotidyltransferase, partial [Roseimicrobium sp.]